MNDIRVERYHDGLQADWAAVLGSSRNGVFLFDRAFMEYHADRFIDFSAIAYAKGKPVALIPAAIDPASAAAISHPGLTFGGVVVTRKLHGATAIAATGAMLDAMRGWGAASLVVKLLPGILATYPADEPVYALWQHGFSVFRRDLSCVLPLQDALRVSNERRRGIKTAKRLDLQVATTPTGDFHALLTRVLGARHDTNPVHSENELMTLMQRFPKRIFIRGAWQDQRLLAGTLVFRYNHVWHTQYLASGPQGRECGALDLVISSLIDEARAAGASHLSFGSCTTQGGTVLNEGLLHQKEGFGARPIVHAFMRGEL